MSKTLTSVLPLSSLLGSMIAPSSSMALEPKPVCHLAKIRDSHGASRVDLRIGSRRITILGWTHLSSAKDQEDLIAQLLSSAADAAQKKECDTSARNLKELLQKQANHVVSHRNLLSDLKMVASEFHPDVLGVEYSPETWEARSKVVQSQADVLDFIKAQCRFEVAGIADNIEAMFPGPEYLFEKMRGSTIRVEPIEDEAVRAKALNLGRQIGALPLLRLGDVNPAARPSLDDFLTSHARGGPVTRTQIEQILKLQGSNEIGVLLGKYLHLLKQLIDLNPARNKRMAEKILAGSGNYVIPIGNSHVTDLADQLHQGCLRGEGIGPHSNDIPSSSLGSRSRIYSTKK